MDSDSDFMARYLPPENPERRDENTAPPGQTEEPSMTWPSEPPQPRVDEPATPDVAAPVADDIAAAQAPAPADAHSTTETIRIPDWVAGLKPPVGETPPVPPNPAPSPPRPTGSHTAPQPETSQPPNHRAAPENGARWRANNGPANQHPAPSSQPPPRHYDPRFDPAAAAARWTPRADASGAAATGPHDYIRVDEVVKTRRQPPEMGWRKAVYVSTGHLVNLGAGPAERRLRDHQAAIAANIPGNYQIAALGIKGGVGKTRITAAVGTVFAMYRKEPVIAVDANPTYGGLGRLIDPRAVASMREFLADQQMTGYPKARHYTGQNPKGLEVLAGNQNVANPLALSAAMFSDTLARTRRFYQLALIDCCAEIEHQVMPGILSAADSLMIIGSMNIDGGLAAEQTIDWLAARNGHELLKRSVVVLNDVYRCEDKKFVTHITSKLAPRVSAVKTIPWDPHLRDAATLDFDALRRPTQLKLIDLAAELAGGFPTAGALAA
ncbi:MULTISPECIES: MinD/ParA family ATP-binding protein [Mycobacterium]|uniref:MinD/ParA family ATP-binding protein n=1 Tax=Mycobacterium TaxID=1763 RepID=UPI000694AF94|nr:MULTISPECIES: MinD/ParA family protein [Mycobacterium]MCV7034865.1 hypothetical protein [Mycobacterium heckeshornense]